MIDPVVARKIKLLGLDVDGVLTDNGVYIGSIGGERVEFKRFDIQDGLAMALLRETDIGIAWVSGRESEATRLRGRELKIPDVIEVKGATKLPVVEALLARKGLDWDQLAFVGDDIADVPVLRRCGLPIAVANAVDEVKDLASYITGATGGRGAVREVIEAVLKARGSWAESVGKYLKTRGDDAA
jgi:3-deoxy-D-manno-octulosonate 8-phosphate phosphatase (KDO 8-P phosphatase)